MTLSFEIFINKINKSISFNTTEFLMKYYLLKKKLRNKIIKKKKKTIPTTYTNHKEEFHFIRSLMYFFLGYSVEEVRHVLACHIYTNFKRNP